MALYICFGIDGNKACYKYNLETKEFTRIADLPQNMNYGRAVLVGNEIYIVLAYYTNIYKYDIENNSFTLRKAFSSSLQANVCVIGTDIYIIGNNSVNAYPVIKYDTVNNTLNNLTNLTVAAIYETECVPIGTDIYIIGAGKDHNQTIKYDTLTQETTNLNKSTPYNMSGSKSVAIGNQIYIFGGSYQGKYFYIYDIEKNTYTKMTDIPQNFYSGSVVKVNEKIYLFGSVIQVFVINYKDYPDKSIVVWGNSGKYKTELYDDERIIGSPKFAFHDVWEYTNENKLDNNIPTYYGNGTSWIKFKN